ncbi:hypothetical protein AURDEDRAFT_113113 [Auricularia subglabra TFB-10046 SS5]|nr:hypothetical protein AURDEDRAFT_113113 [Auricularia subglabra TFB-10046 SS5]
MGAPIFWLRCECPRTLKDSFCPRSRGHCSALRTSPAHAPLNELCDRFGMSAPAHTHHGMQAALIIRQPRAISCRYAGGIVHR